MIKATLTHKNTRTPKTEEIELPDTADTGDIICVISEAIRNSNYADFITEKILENALKDGTEIFEIALEDGTVYHCYEVVINKYRLYIEYFDEEGFEYYDIADFMLTR